MTLISCEALECGVENSVEEGRRFGRGKFLREFERFVDHDVRRSGAEAQFVDRQPQNAAIDGRETFEPPVFRKLANKSVRARRLRLRRPSNN